MQIPPPTLQISITPILIERQSAFEIATLTEMLSSATKVLMSNAPVRQSYVCPYIT